MFSFSVDGLGKRDLNSSSTLRLSVACVSATLKTTAGGAAGEADVCCCHSLPESFKLPRIHT